DGPRPCGAAVADQLAAQHGGARAPPRRSRRGADHTPRQAGRRRRRRGQAPGIQRRHQRARRAAAEPDRSRHRARSLAGGRSRSAQDSGEHPQRPAGARAVVGSTAGHGAAALRRRRALGGGPAQHVDAPRRGDRGTGSIERAAGLPAPLCAGGRPLLPRRYLAETALREPAHDCGTAEHAVEAAEMIEHVATVSEASARFASFSAMRVAHTTLLRHYRDKGTSPDLLAEADLFLTQGSATGALIDDDDDRMAAQSLLDYWAAVLCRADRPPVKAVLDDFDPKLSPSLADAVCPYVGLEAFNETTQELYFGRRRVTEELLKFVQGRRLIGVIGPSGSGKSSLVLGGMIPALKVGGVPGSERWRYYPAIVPGANPIANLIAAVQSQAPAGTDPLTDPAKIVATVDDSGDTAGVFVVDQFEELFTLCETDEKREEFVNALLGLTKSQVQPHLVIVTIRSDFETQLPTVTGLQEAFENATYRVPPFTAADLREAIERPADLVGLKFES